MDITITENDGAAVAIYAFTITSAFEDRPVIDTTSPFFVAEPKVTLAITDALTPPGLYNTITHQRCDSEIVAVTMEGRRRTVTVKITASAVSAFYPQDTGTKLKRLVQDQAGRARPYLGRPVKLTINPVELTDQWVNPRRPEDPSPSSQARA